MSLLLLLLAGLAQWPKTSTPDEAPGLYARSLRLHVATTKLDTLRVLCSKELTLPTRIGPYPVVQEASQGRLLRGRPSNHVIRLLPLQLKQGDIVVTLVDYAIFREGQDVNLALESNEFFRYRYNPINKTYRLVNRKKVAV